MNQYWNLEINTVIWLVPLKVLISVPNTIVMIFMVPRG